MMTVLRKLVRKYLILNMLVAAAILLCSMQNTYTRAAANERAVPYHIKTKRYERKPDRTVKIKFGKIEGINQRSAENINYVLEKEAFRMAAVFMASDLKKKESSIFDAIDKIYGQDIYVWYDILYQDNNILSIQCLGESFYYSEENPDSIILSPRDGKYLVFDIRTGRQLKLSDFITIDKRIINYKADDYEVHGYTAPWESAAMVELYSFKDAFGVYEKKKDEYHNEMSVKEALKRLKNGRIEWAIDEGKALTLRAYHESIEWIDIPYSYIKDFAKY